MSETPEPASLGTKRAHSPSASSSSEDLCPPQKVARTEGVSENETQFTPFGSMMHCKIREIENCELQELSPLGLILTRKGTARKEPDVPPLLLKLLTYQYGFVVLRNFKTLNDDELVKFASGVGEPVIWTHGPILHLKPSLTPQNFVMSFEALPMHWDLMFPPSYLESDRYEEFTASFQIFQCVTAPKPGEGGCTTFCDGRKLLQAMDAETVEKWRSTSLTYFTPRSYFGGKKKTYPLVMDHPSTHDPILRYHPPWDSEIQKVSVESDQLDEEQLRLLIESFEKLIFDPRWFMEFQWEDGDLLIADNHYLLHARSPILQDSPNRHLMRIQVIDPSFKIARTSSSNSSSSDAPAQ